MPEGPGPRGFPSHLGRYRLIARIGRGAMGLVYSAHDEVIDRRVALKVLNSDLESHPETRERFYREARAAARLRHPNVITVFDAGEEDGRLFIAMELLEGSSLEAYLKRPEAASLGRKLDMMIQLCEGLAAAHAQGIVHRDLKPSNLFVPLDGRLKILDFGVARLADSSMTVTGQMLGTPQYMAPEQARGGVVDARSDIFSTGGVFYFMLSGRGPFPGPDLPRLLQQLQFEEPAPLPDVPADLLALVLQAMAKSPDDRPSRVEDLLAGLVRFRRQYQAEMRRLLASAWEQFDAAHALAMRATEAQAALGVLPESPADAALQQLREQYAVLAQRGPNVDATSFDQHDILVAVDAIDEQRGELTRQADALASYRTMLDAGAHAMADGDARTALQQFEAVLIDCPHATRARDLAQAARPLAHEQDARDERLREQIAAARTAIDERRWPAAVSLCDDVLAESPGDERALALRTEAERAIAQEQRRLALALQKVVERAEQAIAQHQFFEAEGAIKEAAVLQPESEAIARLRQRLADERAAVDAAEALGQATAEEIRSARGAFRRGRYDEAVQQLRGFLEIEPDAADARAELSRLIVLREEIAAAAAAARRRVQDLLREATALTKKSALAEALATAQQAMLADPTDAEAAALVDDLFARTLTERVAVEQQRDLDARNSLAAPLLAAAQQALDRGYPGVALKAALAAQRVAPARAELTQLIEQLRIALSDEDDEMVPLAGVPLAPTVAAAPVAPGPASEPARPQADPAGSVLSHASTWAADLFRRRSAKG